MKSFGLWYKKREDSEDNDPKISLHINFWSLEDIKTQDLIDKPYLDIGIKVEDYKLLEELIFHCPFLLGKKNIEDLSKKLETKNNSSIIFNEDCEIETKDSYTIVKLLNGDANLLIFPLEQVIDDIFAIENVCESDKTNIIFKFNKFLEYIKNIDQLKDIKEIYIRFRIQSIALKDKIYFDSEPLNKSFDSAFSGTRIIDFKVNEKRNIDEKTKAKIIVKKQTWAELKKVHFLIMEPSSYDLTSFSGDDMNCRELEEDMWDDYLGTKIDFTKGHVLAYHWKGKGAFSCLVKVNYSKARISTIVAYSLVVIAFGIISSMIVSLQAVEMVDLLKFFFINIGVAVMIFVVGIFVGRRGK